MKTSLTALVLGLGWTVLCNSPVHAGPYQSAYLNRLAAAQAMSELNYGIASGAFGSVGPVVQDVYDRNPVPPNGCESRGGGFRIASGDDRGRCFGR